MRNFFRPFRIMPPRHFAGGTSGNASQARLMPRPMCLYFLRSPSEHRQPAPPDHRRHPDSAFHLFGILAGRSRSPCPADPTDSGSLVQYTPNGIRILAPVGMYPDVVQTEPGNKYRVRNRARCSRTARRAENGCGSSTRSQVVQGDADRTAQFTFLVKAAAPKTSCTSPSCSTTSPGLAVSL